MEGQTGTTGVTEPGIHLQLKKENILTGHYVPNGSQTPFYSRQPSIMSWNQYNMNIKSILYLYPIKMLQQMDYMDKTFGKKHH